MNKLREVVKGTNYSIVKFPVPRTFAILHRPTNSFVTLVNGENYTRIIEGETPKSARGKGIGTNLRALATLYAIFANKRITQTGVNSESLSKIRKAKNANAKNTPTSTFILRERLGWKQNANGVNSVFNPANNRKKLNNWLTTRGFMF